MTSIRVAAALGLACAAVGRAASGSDHLDTPTVVADPRADIADVYAWTAPDGQRLNLIMTIVGQTFSPKLDYVLHVGSGENVGATTAEAAISCRFSADQIADCRLGALDRARGDASAAAGLESEHHRFRVFAGLRDDPFFNNVRGTRAAYQTAKAALPKTAKDEAGCPRFDEETARAIAREWRGTNGGPAKNFLDGWRVSALVVSVDLEAVTVGGKLIAVWGATLDGDRQLDRAGRPLTGNALLGTIATSDESDRLKEEYNAATPATAARFIPELEKGLQLYDGLDGSCGNQFRYDRNAKPDSRYRRLAALLADDRLWVDSRSTACTQLFGVELVYLEGRYDSTGDCGGRTPLYDAANAWRSLLVGASVDDGVHRDDREHSVSVFPLLAAPGPKVASQP